MKYSKSIFLLIIIGTLWSEPINFIQPKIGQYSNFSYINYLGIPDSGIAKLFQETIVNIDDSTIYIESFQLDSNLDRIREIGPISMNMFNRSKLNLDSINSLTIEESLNFILQLKGLDNDIPFIFKLINYKVGNIVYDTLITSYKGQGGIQGYVHFMTTKGNFVGFYRLSYDPKSINQEGYYEQDYLYNILEYYLSDNQKQMDSIYFNSEPHFNFVGSDSSLLKDSIFTESVFERMKTEFRGELSNIFDFPNIDISIIDKKMNPPAIFLTDRFMLIGFLYCSIASPNNSPASFNGFFIELVGNMFLL